MGQGSLNPMKTRFLRHCHVLRSAVRRSCDLLSVGVKDQRSRGEKVTWSLFSLPDDDDAASITGRQQTFIMGEWDVQHRVRVTGQSVDAGSLSRTLHIKEIHAHVFTTRHWHTDTWTDIRTDRQTIHTQTLCVGSVMVRKLDLQSRGCRFNSQSGLYSLSSGYYFDGWLSVDK